MEARNKKLLVFLNVNEIDKKRDEDLNCLDYLDKYFEIDKQKFHTVINDLKVFISQIEKLK